MTRVVGLCAGDALRRHVHRVAGPGVAAPVRLSAPETENAEAAEFDLLATVQGLDDAVEHGVDDDLGALPGEAGDMVHLLDERRLRQAAFGHPFDCCHKGAVAASRARKSAARRRLAGRMIAAARWRAPASATAATSAGPVNTADGSAAGDARGAALAISTHRTGTTGPRAGVRGRRLVGATSGLPPRVGRDACAGLQCGPRRRRPDTVPVEHRRHLYRLNSATRSP